MTQEMKQHGVIYASLYHSSTRQKMYSEGMAILLAKMQ